MSKHHIRAAGGVRAYPSFRSHRCALALGVGLALAAASAQAQQADPPAAESGQALELETVQVKGVRGALMRAQDLKQNADQIIDSVTAQDIGALPDRSVTETLKRVSGVTVTNFLARDDPDHFSAEGSGVMIRGLTQVRGELNGRDIFSANGGRGLSFEEVPSELMAGVDVYKNPSADIIEGGLGGTVNLRTRMPFDYPGQKIAGSVDYNYGDWIKKGKPSASFQFSDRWQTGIGEIGALVNVSYSELATRSDGIQMAPYARRTEPEVLAGTDFDQVFIPGGINWRQLDFDRKRQGLAAALQWRPNDSTEVYSQFLRSEYDMQWRERAMFLSDEFDMANGDGKSNSIIPVEGTQFKYDANGVFQSGYARIPGDGWHPAMAGGGIAFNTDNRLAKQSTTTTDWSIGFRHFITDQLVVRGDYQYVDSASKPTDFTVFTSIYVPGIHMDASGKYPQVTLENPDYFLDPGNYYWRAAMDHLEDNKGNEHAARVDLEWTFDDNPWLRYVRFGARATDRGQVNQNSGWNWGAISDTWAAIDNPPNNVAYMDQYYTSDAQLKSLGNFWRGRVKVPTQLWYPSDRMTDIDYANQTLGELVRARGWGWAPDTFQPQDRNAIDERTQAAYGALYFGNDALSVPVDGNVGVRVVKTSVTTEGSGQMPIVTGENVTEAVRARYAGQYFSTSSQDSYTDVLPSVNLRLRFTDQLQMRLAASKAIARPGFTQMQAWLPLGVDTLESCTSLEPCGLEGLTNFAGSAGNPDLEPMQANQYDAALEWYFGPSNSLYATFFHKDVKGYFATQTRPETYDGDVYQVTRPYNLDEGRIRGFEVGYSQFFDFLPGFLRGLGVQANYTYVDSEGGANTIPDPYGTGDRTALVDLPLEGLSKDSYNVVGIYELGKFSFRLAYNWRSRYLLTSSDVSTRLPTWADDYGQLDGSFFYNLSDSIQIGIQANNLNNATTKVLMGPHLYPSDGFMDERLYTRGYFMNDRRYSAVLRASW